MKKLLLALAGLLALVVAGVLALNAMLEPVVRKVVVTLGPQIAGVPMSLGSLSVSPFSGSLRLSGIVIGNPPGYKTPSLMQVGEVRVGVRLRSLFSDAVVIDHIIVRDASATYEVGPGGSNVSVVQKKVEALLGASPADAGAKSSHRIILSQFRFEGGKVLLSASVLGGQALELPVPDIHLEDIGGAKGTSPAKAGAMVLKAVTGGVAKAALGAGKVLADRVGSAAKTAEKVVGGLKKLFK